jgi:hypothetical protein
MRLIILVLLLATHAGAEARAQPFGPCASIADPAARLQCYDRQGAPAAPAPAARPTAPPQQRAAAPAEASGSCTRAAPCTGPRGGRYYFTPSGAKRYL